VGRDFETLWRRWCVLNVDELAEMQSFLRNAVQDTWPPTAT
jgi:hypothetical protein